MWVHIVPTIYTTSSRVLVVRPVIFITLEYHTLVEFILMLLPGCLLHEATYN